MESRVRYNDTLLEHYRNPRNVGEIEGTPAVAQVGDAGTGDVLKLSLLIQEDVVVEARFKSFGCTAAIAAGSMVTTMIRGLSLSEAARITNGDVARALGGLPESKLHCSVLAEQAIREALRLHREARDQETKEPPCR